MATIRKRGNRWQVQVRRDGFAPTSKSFLLYNDAVAWGRALEVKVDRDEIVMPRRYALNITFGELVDRYEKEISINKASYATEKYTLARLRKHLLSKKTCRELVPEDFLRYRLERLKTVLPASVNRETTIIKHIFSVARVQWTLPFDVNFLERAVRFDVSEKKERRVAPADFICLSRAVNRRTNPILIDIIHFALETAMRRGEILNIEWSHYDKSKQVLFVPITKTNTSRTVPLSLVAAEILENRFVQGKSFEKLFPISANAVRQGWVRLLNRAGLSKLRFHDLRHEAITSFFERGLSVPEVALISGHKSYRTLMRYTHLKATDIVQKLDRRQSMPQNNC